MNGQKSCLFCFMLLVASSVSFAQTNLVPNSSFENLTTCPTGNGQLNLAIGWYSANTGNPDCFNQCNLGMWGVPNNVCGTQGALNGIGYGGLTAFDASGAREYIEIQTSAILTGGKKYRLSFSVCLTDSSNYACNSLGGFFSSTTVSQANLNIILSSPQVTNDTLNPLVTKNQWVQVSGEFVASGGEQFLVIGNFSSAPDTVYVGGGSASYIDSYYYIDDVSLTDQGWVGISEFACQSIVAVIFPNPTSGLFSLQIDAVLSGQEINIVIKNPQGQEVLARTLNQHPFVNELSLNGLAEGVYFYSIFYDEINISNGKIILAK